jgi:3-mercaptopyruvate sulfurtransferase SseA
MSGLNFDFMQTAVSYWMGALSEPVLMIDRADMALAAARGAIVWDVRAPFEFESGHDDRAVSLGNIDWLLAENGGGNLIPADVIADVLREHGIQPGRKVVVYAEGRAVDAFVALRALRSIGVGDAQVCLGDDRHAATARPLPAAGARNASAAARPQAVSR